MTAARRGRAAAAARARGRHYCTDFHRVLSPALFPRAAGRVRSGLAALAQLGYSSSRATAGGGVEFRPFPKTLVSRILQVTG